MTLAGSGYWTGKARDGSGNRLMCGYVTYSKENRSNQSARVIINKAGLYKISPGAMNLLISKVGYVYARCPSDEYNDNTDIDKSWRVERTGTITWESDTAWTYWRLYDGEYHFNFPRPHIDDYWNSSQHKYTYSGLKMYVSASLSGYGQPDRARGGATDYNGSSHKDTTHTLTSSSGVSYTFYNTVNIEPGYYYVVRYLKSSSYQNQFLKGIKGPNTLQSFTNDDHKDRRFIGLCLTQPDDPLGRKTQSYPGDYIFQPGQSVTFDSLVYRDDATHRNNPIHMGKYTSSGLSYDSINLYPIYYKDPSIDNLVAYRVTDTSSGVNPDIENISTKGFISFKYDPGYGGTVSSAQATFTHSNDSTTVTLQQSGDMYYAYTADGFCPLDSTINVDITITVTDPLDNVKTYTVNTYISSSEVGIDLFIQPLSRKINIGIGYYAEEYDDGIGKLDIAKDIRLIIDNNAGSGTTDGDLYSTITDLGWESSIIAPDTSNIHHASFRINYLDGTTSNYLLYNRGLSWTDWINSTYNTLGTGISMDSGGVYTNRNNNPPLFIGSDSTTKVSVSDIISQEDYYEIDASNGQFILSRFYSIDDIFYFESGMTWSDWVNSAYNIDNFVVYNNGIYTNDDPYATYIRDVSPNDTIISEQTYYEDEV